MLQSPLIKVPFRYGLIGGVLACAVITSLYYMGRHPMLIAPYFDFRIVIFSMFIFLALKEVRDYHQQGNLFFWQGMIGSYVFITTTAVMGSVFTWCIARWDVNFLPSYISTMTQELKDFQKEIVDDLGSAAYQQQMARLPQTSPFDLAADYFLKSMIIGLFLTIIISVILRKQTQTQ